MLFYYYGNGKGAISCPVWLLMALFTQCINTVLLIGAYRLAELVFTPHFLCIEVDVKRLSTPHSITVVGGRRGCASCKEVLLWVGLFLYRLNFMKIIGLSPS